jgi:hypothetical protein
MTLTNRKRLLLEEKRLRKIGKACEDCGSMFEITEHHDKDDHLNRKDPNKDPHIIYLCATCHELRDHDKNISCCSQARIKRYEEQMTELENRFNKITGD